MSPQVRRFLAPLMFLIAHLLVTGTVQAQDAPLYSPDLLAMQGRWIRSDAPYVIELRYDPTHTLKARYFNPRPINVAKTETTINEGRQFVMIELQDVNYDGSLYLLNYDRGQDALDGIYVHGASGQRFQVRFSRQTSP